MSTIDPKAVWPGWETVRLLGRGSFGAVYVIQRDVFGETEKAALKLISIPQSESDISEMRSDGYDDESITSTFQAHLRSIVAEYSLMRKLNGSANVVNCDDVRYVQHENGFGWDILIKMELLTPLTQALPGEIPEEQAVKIGKDLARALVQCRQFDIVHRDIKPQNIFISPLGDYKLGDFGIAKTVEKTSGGTKIGTYKYMAPEVYNNQPYGAGADIYSLGLVLYWLLNERRMPFLPLPPAKLGAGMEEQARLRRFRGEQIPAPLHGSEALKQIVLKCCAFDPKDRFANAEELLQALEGLLQFSPERNLVEPVYAPPSDEEKLLAWQAQEVAGLAAFGRSSHGWDGFGRSNVPVQSLYEEETISAAMPASGRTQKTRPTPVGADALGGPRKPETAAPEDETVGVFGASKAEKNATAVGAAISRPAVKEPAPDEEATVSAANPVGVGVLGGPKPTTDGNGLSRALAPTPETTVPAEDATVGVFGAATPVGAAISRPPVKEPAPDEEATVSSVQRPQPQAPKQTRESKNTPAPAKKPEPVQPKPTPKQTKPEPQAKPGKKKLWIALGAIAALAVAALALFLLLGKGGSSGSLFRVTRAKSVSNGQTQELEYTYNEDKTGKAVCYIDGGVFYYEELTLNSKGQVIQADRYDGDHIFLGRSKYSYDSRGNQSYYARYDDGLNLEYEQETEFDEYRTGTWQKQTWYSSDGTELRYTEFKMTDKTHGTSKTYEDGACLQTNTCVRYYDGNKLVKQQWYDQDGNPSNTITWTRDENYNYTSYQIKYSDGRINSFEYEYERIG